MVTRFAAQMGPLRKIIGCCEALNATGPANEKRHRDYGVPTPGEGMPGITGAVNRVGILRARLRGRVSPRGRGCAGTIIWERKSAIGW